MLKHDLSKLVLVRKRERERERESLEKNESEREQPGFGQVGTRALMCGGHRVKWGVKFCTGDMDHRVTQDLGPGHLGWQIWFVTSIVVAVLN
jgi:hypothetical protein